MGSIYLKCSVTEVSMLDLSFDALQTAMLQVPLSCLAFISLVSFAQLSKEIQGA